MGVRISEDVWDERMDGMEGREEVGLTKKRMIHVSTTVRLAGRMENQDMKGRIGTAGFEAGREQRRF